MHICVVGAGIVGLASAYALQQAGHMVSIIDRAPEAAMGASGGNGAQLSYAYVQPLADPGIWRSLPQLLLDQTSPLHLRWQCAPQQWAWLLQFMGACNTRTSQATTASLLQLAAESRQALEAMLQREQLTCDFHQPGKLVLLPSAQSLSAAAQQVQLQARLNGPAQRIVNPAEAVAIEPTLQHYADQFQGAVYTESECAIDCRKLCQALLERLQQAGAQLYMGCEVQRWRSQNGRLTGAHTNQGLIQADHFVLAGGWESTQLARPLGIRLPVYPLKGYSLTLDCAAAMERLPRVSITDTRRKVVFARVGERLRVAGMVELVGADTTLQHDRIERLRQATQQVFPDLPLPADLHPWTGMRPATPTGLPITGRLPQGPRNLWLQTGHGALGLTLAFGSAQRLRQAMASAQ